MRLALGSGGPDHYYNLTALLAAKGAQTSTSRVIATTILGLGFIPLLAIVSSVELQWPAGKIVFAVIFGCCCAAALVWLRSRWPSRAESAALVVLGTLLIAVASIIPADPLYGAVGAAAFAMVASYTALFHTPRLVVFVLVVAATTITYLAVRIAAEDVAVGLSASLLAAMITMFGAFVGRMVVRVSGTGHGPDAIEPLTGLRNRDSFYESTATLLASRSRDDDRYLVVAVVNIDSFAAMVSLDGARGGAQVRVGVGQALRETVRRDAIVGHVGEAEYLIADTFTAPDPSPLIERVRGAIATIPLGTTVSIGVVSTLLRPLSERPPEDVIDEVVALATTAMYDARRAGGNQARYVLRPSLNLVDEEDPDPDAPVP